MSSRDQTYKSLARNGVTMTTAATVTYTYEQIDQARAAMNTASNETAFEGLETSSRRRHGNMTDIADQR
jgi:N-acetylglucosamine-6-phosphate deacetylase